jgi:hypothetical protein
MFPGGGVLNLIEAAALTFRAMVDGKMPKVGV